MTDQVNICKNCGVELEEDMKACPLCGQDIHAEKITEPVYQQQLKYNKRMTAPQRKFTWEIVSLVLLSAMVVTFIINYILDKRITWSEYPVAISLIIFTYLSLFAFWRQRAVVQMILGFVLASASIIALDYFTAGIQWVFIPAIPLLFVTTIIVIIMLIIIDVSKHKGINLLAWGFLAAGLLCISIDAVLSYYKTKQISLHWSVIVAACIIPVVVVLLFVHFRLKKGRSLEKTFHI